MNSSGIMSRLGIKVTVIASIALAIAFGMYLFIYEVATPEFLFSRKFNGFWIEKQNAAFQSFQAYVSERELTIQAAIEDINWEINYPTMHPHLERYNSENAESYGSEEYDKHKIQCSDGIIYAFFYPDTGYYYNISFVIAVVIAAICFFSIFLPYVYHIIHRITRLLRDMEVLAGGDLSYKIIATGRDEIAELGRDIEGMRCSVLEQMAHKR